MENFQEIAQEVPKQANLIGEKTISMPPIRMNFPESSHSELHKKWKEELHRLKSEGSAAFGEEYYESVLPMTEFVQRFIYEKLAYGIWKI